MRKRRLRQSIPRRKIQNSKRRTSVEMRFGEIKTVFSFFFLRLFQIVISFPGRISRPRLSSVSVLVTRRTDRRDKSDGRVIFEKE